MAAKFQGRAYLSSFVDAILDKLSSLDVNSNPTARKLSDQNLFRRLRASLRATRPVLDDAEQKQIRDQQVKEWLLDLHDALYLVDDLLDELSTKAVTLAHGDPGKSSSWSHYVDSILEDSDELHSMQDVVHKLESIVEEKDDLGLKQELLEDPDDMLWRIQSSLLDNSRIYGRDDDKEAIIRFLLDDTCNDKLSIISVEGSGGVGKTTLAQLVYNDARVKEKFDTKAWVCVATKFNLISVSKAVIEDITSSPCKMDNLNSLQTQLKEELLEKTFLVVLDDVWDNQQCLWDNFLKPFLSGNRGSKILLTTRNKNVDSGVSTKNLHYKVDTLSDKNCWLLFLEHSSLSTNSRQYPTLEKIGRQIVRRCKGLPLAIKTLGRLLHNKYDKGYWEEILESEFWKFSEDESKIVPALRVSYHYLPSHLKRCFVYCLLYPEDYQFNKKELILLWIAEDLVRPIENNTLESIGCAYFEELVARSFFQPSSHDVSLFVMHDLMHDLATSFAENFYCRVEGFESPQRICSKIRHLSYTRNYMDPTSLSLREVCDKAIHMRTFLNVNVHFLSDDIENECSFLLAQLRCLRVLSFKFFIFIESLPDSIEKLIHLRYLDLSYTLIVRLPESLCKLYNLQTLKLSHCSKLEMLPSRLQDLVNLHHLDIEETTSLIEMPKGMSNLTHLDSLWRYIVGRHEENGIRELGTLDNLHGLLCISNLENVNSSGEALESKMGNKKHITILELKWLPLPDGDTNVADVQTERDILDKLQPHGNLKELSIDGYRGEIFPHWLGLSCYASITKMSLIGCKNCRQLPSLGQLPALQHLEIFKLDELEIIGCGFYKSNESFQSTPFKSLETLKFEKMSRWREWHFPKEFDGFPKLMNFSIKECPVLTEDLPAHLPSLEKLTILECEELACSLPRAPKLHQLSVMGRWAHMMEAKPDEVVISETQLAKYVLECLPLIQLPHIQRLKIIECSSEISISGDYLPTSLQYLRISGCSNLTFSDQLHHKFLREIHVKECESLKLFPLAALPNLKILTISRCEKMEYVEVAEALPSLSYLSIANCPRLVSFPALGLAAAAPHLEELYLWHCPEMDSFGEECLPPSLATLWINNCQKLATWITSKGFRGQGLTKLILEDWNDVKSFPREGCLPASLQSLKLSDFPNLETLDCKGLRHLTSLQQLSIDFCPKLENITHQNLPSSISKLHIGGECPLRRKLEEMNDPRIQS
ncbi:hypothetical protein PIB30_020569 [Stylosanthes scabra]|uniref:Disease resistance RPP13-like protein 1 n=1 Tax=Stylosanthes scabra TaxID=79078 RepID=A0ABU6Q8I3_9FABA|nr:hypothetical protein [Stylosanthes scabra]